MKIYNLKDTKNSQDHIPEKHDNKDHTLSSAHSSSFIRHHSCIYVE